MSYKVTINNTYGDKSVLRLQFDTNSVLIHEAYLDAQCEAFTHRNLKDNKVDPPVKENITLNPL